MEAVRRQFETNVFGLIRMTQLALPGMRRQYWGRVERPVCGVQRQSRRADGGRLREPDAAAREHARRGGQGDRADHLPPAPAGADDGHPLGAPDAAPAQTAPGSRWDAAMRTQFPQPS
jgi:hypothetical protein